MELRTATSDARRRSASQGGERGFTLAALLVILTIISIMVAYTVPHQWSLTMQRERDYQTLFAMRQYARAIRDWNRAHQGWPTTISQLKDARSPRFVRGVKSEWTDPMTGETDWILIPPGQPGQGTGGPVGTPGFVQQSPWNRPDAKGATTATAAGGIGGGAAGTTSTGAAQPMGSKDYTGPFIGVRPNKSGDSYLTVNGANKYEQWSFTAVDLENEINARLLVQPAPGTRP